MWAMWLKFIISAMILPLHNNFTLKYNVHASIDIGWKGNVKLVQVVNT